MQSPGRSYGIAVALGAALLIAACSASPGASPTTAAVSDVVGGAALAGSASGSGGPAAPGRGTGTPTCDGTGPGPKDGTCTGTTGPDPADIASVLEAALQEEYKAEMLYRSVLADYPGAAPFVSIEQAEERHLAALTSLFARRALAPPASVWTKESFPAFTSLALACAAGVQAEKQDAALYQPYLERADLPQDVRNVFTNLQAASLENHLPAFELCL